MNCFLCNAPVVAQGYCNKHYQRLYAAGVLKRRKTPNGEPLQWIEAQVGHEGDACVTWPYATTKAGYPVVTWRGTQTTAHRVLCEMVFGPAPTPEHEAAHSCGKGHLGCMNPNHLRWATHVENCEDRLRHGTARNMPKKLSDGDVSAIRQLVLSATPRQSIAAQFGVSSYHIWQIASGRRRTLSP